MNYKDKIEFKKEILQDIYECFSFDFLAVTNSLSMDKILKKIDRYENELEGIKNNEDSN